jgi:hypothetical protein
MKCDISPSGQQHTRSVATGHETMSGLFQESGTLHHGLSVPRNRRHFGCSSHKAQSKLNCKEDM